MRSAHNAHDRANQSFWSCRSRERCHISRTKGRIYQQITEKLEKDSKDSYAKFQIYVKKNAACRKENLLGDHPSSSAGGPRGLVFLLFHSVSCLHSHNIKGHSCVRHSEFIILSFSGCFLLALVISKAHFKTFS